MRKPKATAYSVAPAAGTGERSISDCPFSINLYKYAKLGIDATYASKILGSTKHSDWMKIIKMQFHFDMPTSRRTPVSNVFVSTEIINKL